ncbi:YdcF family protein [Pseudonocardia sp. HH130630-07]|uniref:YdcF family protein n=1 Tax=Pseudonocardia sp. HH130630-07 TaxID=1690815 RepID=UPI00081522A8|nr:YdcF family protein [Pseudonocardia sp. HH130630-07]ANY09049.1 hypothetical protein AFB00_25460 [Pseudonocardia sp. HH130630-07]
MAIFYGVAAVLAVFVGIGVYREPRRFRNAVLLGLALVCLLLGLFGEIYRLDVGALDAVTVTGAILACLAVLVLAGFLLLNGATMLRREGRRPANLLSLLAGLGCLAVLASPVVAQYTSGKVVVAVVYALLLVAVYLGFLFCSFLIYAAVYGRLQPRTGVDFVVVLGSGLIRGKVPPLLASRLDRAIAVRDRELRGGSTPLLVTSGGQGPDEPLPEARAMADYLVGQGVPADQVLCEDRSRTTEENLRFSRTLMTEQRPEYRCVVVTNNFHAFRAALMARRAGVNGQVVGSPTARYYWPSATLREFVAILAEHPIINGAVVLALVTVGVLVGLEV